MPKEGYARNPMVRKRPLKQLAFLLVLLSLSQMAFKWNQNVYSVEVMWINENE